MESLKKQSLGEANGFLSTPCDICDTKTTRGDRRPIQKIRVSHPWRC